MAPLPIGTTMRISGCQKWRVFLLRKNRAAFGNPLNALVRSHHIYPHDYWHFFVYYLTCGQ